MYSKTFPNHLGIGLWFSLTFSSASSSLTIVIKACIKYDLYNTTCMYVAVNQIKKNLVSHTFFIDKNDTGMHCLHKCRMCFFLHFLYQFLLFCVLHETFHFKLPIYFFCWGIVNWSTKENVHTFILWQYTKLSFLFYNYIIKSI